MNLYTKNIGKTFSGVNVLRKVNFNVEPGEVHALVGENGAGKSTLTSKIIGKELKTNELSNDQGVHTTSISSLYELTDNAKVIDSPGMRDIELVDYSRENIINGFEEIFELSKDCKFNDCNHINNKGCKVIEGLANGFISKSRYNNFIKFRDSI